MNQNTENCDSGLPLPQDGSMQVLSTFINMLSLDEIPGKVKRQAAFCILDTIGCMIAGSQVPETQQVIAAERAVGASGQASIIGNTAKLGVVSAARVNAYMGDIFELNDLIGGHASIGNVATALSLAQMNRATGREFILAVVAGIETTARVYNAFYPYLKSIQDSGMVSVGFPATIGCSAVAARLSGLSADQIANALAVAGAIAGWCPAEVIFGNGGTIKPLMFGASPASAGIQAVEYAKAGLTGPPDILDSSVGYFAAMSGKWDADALNTREWALNEPRRKLHACCGYIHSAFDAVSTAVSRLALDPLLIAQIKVSVPEYIIPAIHKPTPPTTANEARFHIGYMLAIAASGADFVTPAHSVEFAAELLRPQIIHMADRVQISADPELTHYHECKLIIRLMDGTEHAFTNDAPRGSAQNPLSNDALVQKFMALSEPVIGNDRAQQIVDLILSLEYLDDLSPIFDLL
ncbi:MAG: MmgE/PrpD family protein [Marinosulfonomonas sp.]|nr:MmgE/PrpD family protein [Marinosulfonomonas sp.]